MKPITKFVVAPSLPKNIALLKELAYNYWWCWNADAKELFARVDRRKWDDVHHNPVALLQNMSQPQLEDLSQQRDFVHFLDHVYAQFRAYMDDQPWYGSSENSSEGTIAYFSAEFGIHESFPNYSGGLGVLAGDHLKSSSDLGVPLVGIGLLYQKGYFRQYLAQDGMQQEMFVYNDFYSMPLTLMKNERGEPLVIDVDLPKGKAYAQIWKVQVGRVPLYMMDTNTELNTVQEYRDITAQLYGGNQETRIQQEIILGIGGVRALKALGITPKVCHLNEGHAAFAALERTRNLMTELGMPFHQAMEITRAGTIFTTHTPVPAGNEIFPIDLLQPYFSGYSSQLGISGEEFLALGRVDTSNQSEGFSMTVLGLKTTNYRNGVSKLHGDVTQVMWHGLWKNFPEDEVPITTITNGIHTHTWVARELAELYDRYLTPEWRNDTDNPEIWKEVDDIPSEALWRAHQRRRETLVSFVRKHLVRKHKSLLTPQQLNTVNDYLDPDILTIGFARRFATYKRADLLFSDMDRLRRLVLNPQRPVQIIIAGKSHPKDIPGKETIRRIIQRVREYGLDRNIIFLEDYDMGVARHMVKGCDIWLNNPRRPYEASGTSGMKAAVNGCIHVSVLDGWWDEAYNGRNGFAIGLGEELPNPDEQDAVDAGTLYNLLERVITPLFYDRGPNRVPEQWVTYMKECIKSNAGQFSTMRMVRDYARRFYMPAMKGYSNMLSDHGEKARQIQQWKQHVVSAWNGVRVQNLEVSGGDNAEVGSEIFVRARVELGVLRPEDIRVQAYMGNVTSVGEILKGSSSPLKLIHSDGVHIFEGSISCADSGYKGCTVRIVPSHPLMANDADLYLCTWAGQ
ncbi:MAG TPA: alpha-glucan family phosphorylase [Patescibacteria group bacterium]|nr:alpha-glucan family phosphorylase [Patescibacteria group bacterium]